MKTLVIGANGRIGRQLCELAHHEGLGIRAMIRHPNQQVWFHQRGIETVIADLEGDLRHAFRGCDQLVFSAGSGPQTGADRTLMIDLHGAIRAMDLAAELCFDRFIMVSALRADAPLKGPEVLRPYLAAKHAADRCLRASHVPWVILKPGRLTDAPATRRISTAVRPDTLLEVSRGNVAHALCYLIGARALRGREFPLLDGDSNLPMALV